MNKDYKARLKSQYPKTLEQAIKDAHVYDDNTDKPSHAHAQGKNNASNNTNKKRKSPYAQGHNGDNNKKSKGTKGLLSSSKLAGARKEGLCFICLGSHQHKDCPRKQKDKGKEKAVHTVQLLTLAKCPVYLAIEYSHEAPPHECVLTRAPWENRVIPHDLF